jgi:DNA-binding GntR family transcriptional regulator
MSPAEDMDRTAGPEPLYRRVARALKAAIARGDHPVGTLLPTEQEFCEHYGASRYTIREALRLLTEDGLVERRQGRGTEVVSTESRPTFAHALSSLSQLYDYASDTRLEIERVMRIVPDEALAVQLGRKPGREWLLAEGIRRTSAGHTICVSRVFLHQDFADLAPDLRGHEGAIHRLIEARFGQTVASVIQEISGARLEAGVAAILGQPAGDWSIHVVRRYLGTDDRPLVVSLNWHRIDEFRNIQTLRRE